MSQNKQYFINNKTESNLLPITPGYIYPSLEDDGWDLNPNELNPYFVTGLSDGESCFHVGFRKKNKYSTDWAVWLVFKIELHRKDQVLLENIRTYFSGVGRMYNQGTNALSYMVTSIVEFEVIINHFDKYPLITQKRADYELLKQVFELIKNKEHLTIEGVRKIVNIRASMNWGLPDSLKVAFPSAIPVPRPEVKSQKIQNRQWLAGFVAGEGCFFIKIGKSLSHKLGVGIRLVFTITQHIRDEKLLRSFIEEFRCGKIISRSNVSTIEFEVTKFKEITNIIIPFFSKYPLHGDKVKDFNDFKKVAELMKNKAHLTQEGIEEIKNIKSGMNRGRREN